MRIRFLKDSVYEQDGMGNGPRFPKGFVLDSSGVQAALGLQDAPKKEWADGFLGRWLRREVAEIVDGKVKASPIEDMNDRPAPTLVEPQEPADAGGAVASMSDDDLINLAIERGVDISAAKDRDEVIAAIQLADAQKLL